MKLKSFLFALLSTASFSLYAGWVATNTYTLENTNEPLYMATALEMNFTSFRNFLVGMNFVSPHKTVLTHLSGRVDSMKWENDENCQAPNPEEVKKVELTNVDYDSFQTDKPNYITHGFMHEWVASTPCDNNHLKADIKRSISFNNKLQTIITR